MAFQSCSAALFTILILGLCRAVRAATSIAPNAPCALPTFNNVTLLAWSCDQADTVTVREWLFWLNYRDPNKNGDTEKAIQGILRTSDPLLGIQVGIADPGVRYFVANATQQAACNVEQIEDVCVVEESILDAGNLDAVVPQLEDGVPGGNGHAKMRRQSPGDWSVQESPSASELRVFSQPTDVPNWEDVPNFVYQKQAGQDVFIYHVEYGINTQSDDLKDKVLSTIYADTAQQNPSDTTSGGHSTCSASKAAGIVYGVAKNSKIIMARLGGRILITNRSISSVFGLIATDVIQNVRQKKCVLTLSWGTDPPDNGMIPQHWITASKDMRQLMNELDCVIVTSAGNNREEDGSNADIDRYPGLFTSDDFPIINVGSVDNSGASVATSQRGPLLTVWAPGKPILCAPSTGNDPITWSGTSFAAPQVAGLIATFLSLDKVPFDTSDGNLARSARKFMSTLAADGGGSWPRSGSESPAPNVAYNLVTSADNPPKRASA